jgi:hypothetical protein
MMINLPDHAEIAARAYRIYLERGREPGHAMDDWLQAEYELMQLPIHKLADLSSKPRTSRSRGKNLIDIVRCAMLGLGC